MSEDEIKAKQRAEECTKKIEAMIRPVLEEYNCLLTAPVYLSTGLCIYVPIEVVPKEICEKRE